MIRVVWRFHREQVALEDLAGSPAAAAVDLGLDTLARVSPVFSGSREVLRAETSALAEEARNEPENDLSRYFQTFVEDFAAARPILAALDEAKSREKVEWFDVQASIGPPLLQAGPGPGNRIQCSDPGGPTPAYDSCQVYLDSPDPNQLLPSGVGARFAWGIKGGRGENAKIVDVEGSWLLDHEDLNGQVCCRFGNFSNDSEAEAHGTAVLGVLCANPQDPPLQRMGVIGIAHRSRVGVAPFEITVGSEPNPEDVVKRVSGSLEAGDVILLELQAARLNRQTGLSGPVLPMEAWPHGRSAINQAHSKGIYVVEAAGNGAVILTPEAHDVPDTGPAFMVGAGDIVTGGALQGVTNRGPRVDLQGWGDEVVTTGTRVTGFSDLQARTDPRRCYARAFNGTSSASAIVAGCVAVISSVVRAHGHPALSPEDMKDLLVRTGTFQDRAQNGEIGPLPNIQAALEDLETTFGVQFDRI
ncbi:MAG TPA: S8 family serine peptidase [Thermoanaerobaculia bacterium]|jgi:hypothetical protein|nr:S8 family serine peptidase [Thermoanaerobaculia bacterium]